MKKNTPSERLINGIIKENPTFVLMLGMCPTLAITTSAINGIGMGLTTTVILAASNLMISLLRNFIPDSVRMPAYPGLYPVFVFFPWNLHSADRCKLYHPGKSRGLCIQEQTNSLTF